MDFYIKYQQNIKKKNNFNKIILKNKILFHNMESIKLIIICENKKEETKCYNFEIEEKGNSAIIVISMHYADFLMENEILYNKKSTIYFGERLVREYVRLPYKNVYDDDLEMGNICLFPKAKYKLIF